MLSTHARGLRPALVAAVFLASVASCRHERSSSAPQAPQPQYGAPAPQGGSPGAAGPQEHGTKLPADVRQTLERYVHMLATSRSMEELVHHFTPIAGGTLVTEDGRRLTATVPQFSLKKDWQNLRHYKAPPEVTRVLVTADRTAGYGASAIRGTEYKVWIAKRDPQLGMPAPISLLVPEGHTFIQGPRVVGIGSL